MAAVAVLTASVALAYASLGLVLHETVGDDAVLRLPSALVDDFPQISYGPAPPEADAAAAAQREGEDEDGRRGRGGDDADSSRGAGGRSGGGDAGGGDAGSVDVGVAGAATLRLPGEQYPGG